MLVVNQAWADCECQAVPDGREDQEVRLCSFDGFGALFVRDNESGEDAGCVEGLDEKKRVGRGVVKGDCGRKPLRQAQYLCQGGAESE